MPGEGTVGPGDTDPERDSKEVDDVGTLRRTGGLRAMTAAAVGLVVAALPGFLVGGLAVQVRSDLGFSETALGGAVTLFFVTSAVTSAPSGRLSDRVGARRMVRAGGLVTAVALVVLALAPGWPGIACGLVLGGLGLGLTEPALALVLARGVAAARQGLAFGIKEAAIPAATLLAGVAVPLVALTVGWRWAFAGGLLLVPLAWATVPGDLPASREGTADRVEGAAGGSRSRVPTALYLVAAGAGMGVAAVTAMSAFVVEAGVVAGLAPGLAGLMLSAGSAAGMVGRVTAGAMADRVARPQLPVVAMMQVAGAGALALLALAGAVPAAEILLLPGVLLGFGLGWGWTGLLFLSSTRASPDSPAAAAGVVLVGLSAGGGLGPVAFGAVLGAGSFPLAWGVGAVAMLGGAGLILVADRWLARQGQAVPAR